MCGTCVGAQRPFNVWGDRQYIADRGWLARGQKLSTIYLFICHLQNPNGIARFSVEHGHDTCL